MIVCVQNSPPKCDGLIDSLAGDRIAYVPFFPLGGFTPLQSSTLSGVAEALGAAPMQIALAWLLRRAPNILLIPGTSARLTPVPHGKRTTVPSRGSCFPRFDGENRGCPDDGSAPSAMSGVVFPSDSKASNTNGSPCVSSGEAPSVMLK